MDKEVYRQAYLQCIKDLQAFQDRKAELDCEITKLCNAAGESISEEERTATISLIALTRELPRRRGRPSQRIVSKEKPHHI
jgi:hypothetical protein